MNKNVALVIYSRIFLGFAYGYMNVLVSLYLYFLGYSLLFVGLIIGIGTVVNALLALFFGMLADHYGRKIILAMLFMAFGAVSALFLVVRNPYILSIHLDRYRLLSSQRYLNLRGFQEY